MPVSIMAWTLDRQRMWSKDTCHSIFHTLNYLASVLTPVISRSDWNILVLIREYTVICSSFPVHFLSPETVMNDDGASFQYLELHNNKDWEALISTRISLHIISITIITQLTLDSGDNRAWLQQGELIVYLRPLICTHSLCVYLKLVLLFSRVTVSCTYEDGLERLTVKVKKTAASYCTCATHYSQIRWHEPLLTVCPASRKY